MISLSLCIERGYGAILVMKDGTIIHRDVSKVNSTEGHYTEHYLELFNKALFILKTVSEQERFSFEERCVMEMRCLPVVNWFKNLKCPPSYSERFIDTLKLFDSIPFRYSLVNAKEPTAKHYASKDYMPKEVLTSAFDLG